MSKNENPDLLIHKLANRGFAQEKQKKILYAITALAELYKSYDGDSSLADIDDDDNKAKRIVHASLVNQIMRDYEDSIFVQYVEKYVRKLF